MNYNKDIYHQLDGRYIEHKGYTLNNKIIPLDYKFMPYTQNGNREQYAEAFNNENIARGNNSHAEGISSISEGNYSHVEGSGSVAYGNSSHAEGNYTAAVGEKSHAEGEGDERPTRIKKADNDENNSYDSEDYVLEGSLIKYKNIVVKVVSSSG